MSESHFDETQSYFAAVAESYDRLADVRRLGRGENLPWSVRGHHHNRLLGASGHR